MEFAELEITTQNYLMIRAELAEHAPFVNFFVIFS